jgi:hypothetical protein
MAYGRGFSRTGLASRAAREIAAELLSDEVTIIELLKDDQRLTDAERATALRELQRIAADLRLSLE